MGRLRPRPYNIHPLHPRPPASSAAQHSSLPSTTPHPSRTHNSFPLKTINLLSSLQADKGLSAVSGDRRKKTKRLAGSIQRLAGVNAVLTWVVTVLGYFVLTVQSEGISAFPLLREGLKAVIGCASVVQAVLVVYYWKGCLAYSEVLRAALHPCRTPISALLASPESLTYCLLECVFHLFLFLPATDYSAAFSLFGISTSLSLDEVCYLTILLRNYHSVRLLYWLSSFSTLRVSVFSEVASVRKMGLFVLRCCLVEYGLPLILGVYAVMVLIPGLVEFTLEHKAEGSHLDAVENDVWVVVNTQTTVGYGESHPVTFLGQLAILVSALFGYFTLGLLTSISGNETALSLRECTYYSEIRYRRAKIESKVVAAVLVQRWWRLMAMRLRKVLKVGIIVGYFTQLRVYRSTLVSCQRVKDTRFERQIAAFDHTFQPQLRSLQEYLSPVADYRALIIEVYRSAYSIKAQCQSLRKLTHRLVLPPSFSYLSAHESESGERTPHSLTGTGRRAKSRSGQDRAKAKNVAFQKVRSRLVPGSRQMWGRDPISA